MRYDLAVVGSGQGGVPLALAFAKRGKRVVLFERGDLGGCCVNVGCTPSKAFLASAHAAGRARRASDVHVHCDVRVDVPAVLERVRKLEERGVIAGYEARLNPRALGAGLGIGIAGSKVAEATGRNPDAANAIRTNGIIIVVFAVVVIGGMGSIMGSIVTGFGLGVIEGLTKYFYPEASNTVIFVIMAIVLMIRPQGLFGQR